MSLELFQIKKEYEFMSFVPEVRSIEVYLMSENKVMILLWLLPRITLKMHIHHLIVHSKSQC